MSEFDIKEVLQRLYEILVAHNSVEADWMAELIELAETDQQALYARLNSKHMWGGAGSVANEALADNCGIDDWQWQFEIQDFRELMIGLGEHLMNRGQAYPDIGSWLLAFNNWNQNS